MSISTSSALRTDEMRDRVRWVFGELDGTGAEWGNWDGVGELQPNAYWYVGAPDYLGRQDLDGFDSYNSGVAFAGEKAYELRTIVADCLFGFPAIPEGWREVARFSHSGESICGCSGESDRGFALDCHLCEGDGTVYIGDGWHEIVVVRTEPMED